MTTTKTIIFTLLLTLTATTSFAHNHENHKHDKSHNHAADHSSHGAKTTPQKTLDTTNAKGIVKEASIKGMVCAFCVDNIQKVFKKHKEVEDININLDTKLLTLVFKEGQNMDDQKIKKLIKSSGYDVVSIVEK